MFALMVSGHHQSAVAGSIALAIIMIPLVARATQEVLALVPSHLREASLALGVSKWRTIVRVILPTTLSGILTGSILATYGMARGWVEFWLVWIAVDAVGVPLLFQAGYYPSAVLYLVYGAFCLAGFVAWVRTRRTLTATPAPTAEVAA